MLRRMRMATTIVLFVATACGSATDPSRASEAVGRDALHTATGAPIVVVVEMRDHSTAVTADLVRDPARGDLHELRAPRVSADVHPDLLLPATLP